MTTVPGRWHEPGAAAVLSVCLVMACRDRGERSRAPSTRTAHTATAASAPPSASEPRPDASKDRDDIAAPMPDGCFASAPTGGATSTLDYLVHHCAPGTVELLPKGPRRITAHDDGVTFDVATIPTCLRAFVVAGSGAPLRATLRSPRADVLAHSELPIGFGVLAERGPVCVSEPGEYRIDIPSPEGATVLVSVRAAKATPR